MNSDNAVYVWFVVVFGMIAAWFTHVIHCLMFGKYLLLIAGGFIFPVGIIHGLGIWLGVSW
jgi:hypothetical protein